MKFREKLEHISIKKENGITIIALTITIIVMLILAGTVIKMTVGENGILQNTNNSKMDYEKKQEKELLLQAYASISLKSTEKITNENFASNFEAILNDKLNAKCIVGDTNQDDGKIEVIFKKTKNKYSVGITDGEITFESIDTIDSVILAGLKAEVDPTEWTNGDVKVTLPQKSGYTTKYTTEMEMRSCPT